MRREKVRTRPRLARAFSAEALGENLPLPLARAGCMLSASAPPVEVLAARTVHFGGREGTGYRLCRPHAFTGDATLDRALSTFRAVVLVPAGRPPAHTPVVTLLQGITAPLERSAPLVGPLLDAGLALVAFDTPLGGERRFGEGPRGSELAALGRHTGIRLDVAFAERLFDGVAADFEAALAVAAGRHGLEEGTAPDGRLALFGVSFGCLLSAFTSGRDGRGRRLLGVCGHADLPAMARGLARSAAAWAHLPPALLTASALGPALEKAARRMGGDAAVGALRLAALLVRLGRGGRAVRRLDPLGWAADAGPDRPVWFLTGESDGVATPEDTRAAAACYARGEARVVPGLAHGWRLTGPGSLADDCTALILDALADWRA